LQFCLITFNNVTLFSAQATQPGPVRHYIVTDMQDRKLKIVKTMRSEHSYRSK